MHVNQGKGVLQCPYIYILTDRLLLLLKAEIYCGQFIGDYMH